MLDAMIAELHASCWSERAGRLIDMDESRRWSARSARAMAAWAEITDAMRGRNSHTHHHLLSGGCRDCGGAILAGFEEAWVESCAGFAGDGTWTGLVGGGDDSF